MTLLSWAVLCATLIQKRPASGGNFVTLTDWFSAEQCAKERVAAGVIGPPNPDCARRCLSEGSHAVLISDQTREILRVRDDQKLVVSEKCVGGILLAAIFRVDAIRMGT